MLQPEIRVVLGWFARAYMRFCVSQGLFDIVLVNNKLEHCCEELQDALQNEIQVGVGKVLPNRHCKRCWLRVNPETMEF